MIPVPAEAARSTRTAADGISNKKLLHIKGSDRMLEDVKPELTALKEKLNEMGNSL